MTAVGTLRRAAAEAVLRLPPSWLARVVRVTRPAVRRVEPFAWFERDDGRRLALLDGYREHGKGRWRSYWWATRVLLALDAYGALPAGSRELVDALRAGRTLPAPVGEFAERAAAIAEASPDLIRPTGRMDERLGVPVLGAVSSEGDLRRLASVYAAGAGMVAAELRRAGVELAQARVLEAGCGRGHAAAALAADVGEVVGVDLDIEGESLPDETRALRAQLSGGRSVRLDVGDLRELPYPDEAFDAVFSLAVLEHIPVLRPAFAELRRVTRPGGVGYHGIDVWFGTAGGHSLCTLDAPWGHVRLDEREADRYFRELRPHEAEHALHQYRHGFQQPRRTLREAAEAAREAGFEVLMESLTRLPLRDPHRAWFGAEILRDCRRTHPGVEAADLLAVSGTLVLRRR